MLHPSGVKKMGEPNLAIRFSCYSMVDLMQMYFKPHLPKMHYKRPLNVMEQEMLRQQAVNVVAARLSRAEPPLRKEVVEYMSDTKSHLWSMRRSKANFYRLMSGFSGFLSVGRWLGEVSTWKHPMTTVLVHILFLMLVCFPELIMPTMFLYVFVIGMWNWRFRPRHPPHMNSKLSYTDGVTTDELDEEFDTFPSTKSPDIVLWRYGRLRSVAGRVQSVVGDLATQGERVQALVSWLDPRPSSMFMAFCLVSAVVLYMTPFQIPILIGGFYFLRHPMFRSKVPPAPVNFYRRLPALTDSML
ncbi:FT-interacting protein 3 [Lathyrus oleraceus]|nr:FT-interacting protein 3-like [Pisum sativum]KAI5421711.1 variant 3, FT-interacting protein 3 [Pisum sativum]